MKNVKKMVAIALVMASVLTIGGVVNNSMAKESGLELATDPPIAKPW